MKNAIVIDGVVHELTQDKVGNFDCSECSLCFECQDDFFSNCFATRVFKEEHSHFEIKKDGEE